MQEEKYYKEIKNILVNNEVYKKVKDYSKDRSDLLSYYNVGKLIVEAQGGEERAKYGNQLIKKFSLKLVNELDRKYNERTLRRYRQFYILFNNEKWSPMATKITWSNITELLALKDTGKISYYVDQCIQYNLSKRQLREKIKQEEYERLPDATKTKLIAKEELDIEDLIPSPIIIKSNKCKDNITEKILQQLIIENIEDFMHQLGDGYTFVGKEYKIKIGKTYNYIDILLYNIKFKCYVVIELKVTELKKEHTGQIMTYMNYIDMHLKTIEENNTVGIIICKKNNRYVIEYCSDKRIISKEYELMH